MSNFKRLAASAMVAAATLMLTGPAVAKKVRMNIGYSVAEGHP